MSGKENMIDENTKELIDNMRVVLLDISKSIELIVEMAYRLKNELIPVLQSVVELVKPMGVIHRLGELQYVTWKDWGDKFYEKAYTMNDQELLQLVLEKSKEEGYADVEKTLKLLSENEHLKDLPLFAQTVKAYESGDNDLAVLGFTIMLDRLLSVYSEKITNTNINRRVEIIVKRMIENNTDNLNDPEICDFILVDTFITATEILGKSFSFDGCEPELNRHWVAHGRMQRPMEKIDCIRMINMLYGLVLMSKLGEKEEHY